MNYSKKILSLAILTLSLCAAAMGKMTVEMDMHPRVLRTAEPAQLKFTVRGVNNPPAPALQPMNGLQINGPSVGTTMSSSMVNGRLTTDRATIFTYQVLPMQPGTYTIGPFTYEAGGESAQLPAIEFKCVSAQAPTAPGTVQADAPDNPLFARITTSKETLYNQEVFDLYIEIFHRGDLNIGRDISLLDMPTTGLSLQSFEEMNPTREIVDNQIYQVRRFRSKAHALTAGTFTLNPTLRVPLLVPRQRRQRRGFDPFGDFFGSSRTEPVDLRTEPLTLTIDPLPTTGKPATFSGAVGEFKFDVMAKPTDLECGEPVTLTMRIAGLGNVENLTAPVFPESDLFKVYESHRIENEVDAQTGSGLRIFEQVVIPRSDTITELPALAFSYFDPDAQQYKTITQGPFPLTVRPSTKETAQLLQSTIPGSEDTAKVLGTDLIYLKPSPAEWTRTSGTPIYHTGLFWLLQVPPLLAVLLVGLFQRRRNALRADRAKARRLRAPKSARAGLRSAETALKNNEINAVFDHISTALNAYFGDRLNLAPGEVTPSCVLSACREKGMSDEQVKSLEAIFEQCDRHRFGAGLSMTPEQLQTLLKNIPALLKSAERINL